MKHCLTNSWNLSDLGYFDPWLDNICTRQRELEIIGEEVPYRSIVQFIERIEMLVRFKGVALVNANITNSLCGSTFEACNPCV